MFKSMDSEARWSSLNTRSALTSTINLANHSWDQSNSMCSQHSPALLVVGGAMSWCWPMDWEWRCPVLLQTEVLRAGVVSAMVPLVASPDGESLNPLSYHEEIPVCLSQTLQRRGTSLRCDISLLRFLQAYHVSLCVVSIGVHVKIWVCICIWLHVCTCRRRPETDAGWLLHLFAGFAFCLFWQSRSMNLELVTLARLSG